jgi:peroxiredoxin Q/BCP
MKKILFACLVTALGCSKPTPPTETAAAAASPSAAAPGAAAPGAASAEITVGKAPPDFIVKDQDGKELHLAALKGKPVVVYFYPKDETPGCTKEACAFRDAFAELTKKGVVLIGVSGDSDESHRAFIKSHKLPFALVSDPKGELAEKFGVPFHLGFASRQTFVIGADGNVKKLYRSVDVAAHAKEISDDLG